MVKICYTKIMRKDLLAPGHVYHIFNRSIANYEIFNNDDEFLRMRRLLEYYQVNNDLRFSDFVETEGVQKWGFDKFFSIISEDKDKTVQIIAYCIMPTHFHLILKQLTEHGISIYISKILNSYTRYFNTAHKRKGPLWESEFSNVLIGSDEQLLHLTRYLHLNAVTAGLVDRPGDWVWSSYKEYIAQDNAINNLCTFNDILDIKPSSYRRFVNDRISYQRELAKIKTLIID